MQYVGSMQYVCLENSELQLERYTRGLCDRDSATNTVYSQ